MCSWCNNLNSAIQDLMMNDYSGVPIGERIEFYPWDKTKEYKIKIELWYEKEHGRDKKEFLVELSMQDTNKGKGYGIRMVAPIKYCPNCGKELIAKLT